MKSIEDYKKDIVSIIQEMEKEHGCDVDTLCVQTQKSYNVGGSIEAKRYIVEIEIK